MRIRTAIMMLAAMAAGSATALSDQTASMRLTMTVAPKLSECGLLLEMYDEDGYLQERSGPTCPPARLAVRAPNGQRVGIEVPAISLRAPATIQVYFKGTPPRKARPEASVQWRRLRRSSSHSRGTCRRA
jgi:hypothetical protein